MKTYTLEAVVRGQTVKFDKKFTSRTSAINYMFAYLENHCIFDNQVKDEYPVNGDIHNIEYKINYYNRFRVCRV